MNEQTLHQELSNILNAKRTEMVRGPDFDKDNTQMRHPAITTASEFHDRILVEMKTDTAVFTPVETPLPEAVKRFTSEIEKNFSDTVSRLRHTAMRMHDEASALEAKAQELEKAGPDVAMQIRDWIKFERESNSREKYFSTLFK